MSEAKGVAFAKQNVGASSRANFTSFQGIINKFAMNNFGVIELASAKTTSAPGWAYVPDNTIASRSTAPTNRKRARNAPGLTLSDLTARQDTKIRKEVEALDKDGGRDNTIPLPVKSGRGMRVMVLLVD